VKINNKADFTLETEYEVNFIPIFYKIRYRLQIIAVWKFRKTPFSALFGTFMNILKVQ